MTHNSKCEYAKEKECTCECEGKLHGIKSTDSDRKNIVGQKQGRCLKCGDTIHLARAWEHYYCNHYCCNPCCPDSARVPCTREKIDVLKDGVEVDDAMKQVWETEMRKDIHLKRSFQSNINKEWDHGN